jgi:nucleoside-diphosphate-sugar epimerase
LKNLVFITGANGFIGKNFFDTYKAKISIKKIQSKILLKKKKYENLLEKLFLRYKPSILIHFANYYTKTNSLKDAKLSKKINYDYGVILFKLSKKYKVKYFINISTALVLYKNNFLKKYHYFYYKKKFVKHLKDNTEEIKVLQIFLNSVYGDGDKRNKFVPNLLKKLRKKHIHLYDENIPINFISVKDLNKFLIKKIYSKNYSDENFILVSNCKYYLRDLINSLKLKNKIFSFVNSKAPEYIFDKSLGKIYSQVIRSNLLMYLKIRNRKSSCN